MTAHAAVPRPAGTGPRRMAVGGVLLTVPAVVLFLLMLLAPLLFALPSAAVHALLAVAAVAGLVGAGFVVAICGDLMTMPGLPRVPAAAGMRLDIEGRIHGLS